MYVTCLSLSLSLSKCYFAHLQGHILPICSKYWSVLKSIFTSISKVFQSIEVPSTSQVHMAESCWLIFMKSKKHRVNQFNCDFSAHFSTLNMEWFTHTSLISVYFLESIRHSFLCAVAEIWLLNPCQASLKHLTLMEIWGSRQNSLTIRRKKNQSLCGISQEITWNYSVCSLGITNLPDSHSVGSDFSP